MAAITGTSHDDKVKRIQVVDYFNESNEITFTAFKLLYRINKLTNRFGYCFASNAALSEILKIPERSIKRGIAELRKLEAIITDIDPKTSVRKIYIDDKIILLSENLTDDAGCHTWSEDGRSMTPGGDVHDTRGVTCVAPIIYNSNIVTESTKEEKIKKNSEELFFATKIPDDISDYVSKNLMMVSDEQKLKSQLIYDGKYSVIYQILAIKKEANLIHLKPYMELIPDDILHNFSQTLVYAFNNSKSLKHKQEIVKFAIHLLYDNYSQMPLQNAMGLKLNFTELSMSKFSGLRISEGMDVRDRMAEVNSQLKTIDRYLDFPSAMIAYWSHGKTMVRKNKFANA